MLSMLSELLLPQSLASAFLAIILSTVFRMLSLTSCAAVCLSSTSSLISVLVISSLVSGTKSSLISSTMFSIFTSTTMFSTATLSGSTSSSLSVVSLTFRVEFASVLLWVESLLLPVLEFSLSSLITIGLMISVKIKTNLNMSLD
uniref:Uncharacterized protein n=1 Tax=Cacopsylla melanoneura TaxID=428564 RepID=A0A8D9DW61_9HEMI